MKSLKGIFQDIIQVTKDLHLCYFLSFFVDARRWSFSSLSSRPLDAADTCRVTLQLFIPRSPRRLICLSKNTWMESSFFS